MKKKSSALPTSTTVALGLLFAGAIVAEGANVFFGRTGRFRSRSGSRRSCMRTSASRKKAKVQIASPSKKKLHFVVHGKTRLELGRGHLLCG